jgi:S1-C subfamily serine protease
MTTIWEQLSTEMSEVVQRAGKSIVAVDGRSGHTSSGIVWRQNSIITAAHTIRQEASIGVSFGPGRSVTARLAGKDRGTDIAVLVLDEDNEIQPALFGTADALSLGELTIAIARTRRGNIVASAGIISGLMGEWQVARTRIDQFIRPDLNLYPGFSGGALVNAAGACVGLNTSGLLRGKPITIPSSTVLRIAEEIAARGEVTQPYVGLVMQPVQIPESLQKRAGAKAGAGLLVVHVEAGGPADAAGILLGDILLEMEGRAFADLDDVYETLAQKRVGQDVQTDLIRGGQRVALTVRIGERPSR